MKINKIAFGAKVDINTMKIARNAISSAIETKSDKTQDYIMMWETISEAKGEIFVKKRKNIETFYFFCDKMKTPQLFFATHCLNTSQDKLSQIYSNLQKTIADLEV